MPQWYRKVIWKAIAFNGSFTLATFVSDTIGDSDTQQSRDFNCLGHLGRRDTDRIISIDVMPPKVAKASK